MLNSSGPNKHLLGPCELFTFPECTAAVTIWRICSPILFFFGTVGNLLTFAVFSRKRLSKTTTSVYIRVMSGTDILVMFGGPLREFIFYTTNKDLRELSDASCRLHMWFMYCAIGYSAWVLAAMTVDRLVSVCSPVYAKTKCSQKFALVVVVLLLAVVVVLNAHLFFDLFRTELTSYSNETNTIFIIDVQCLPSTADYSSFYINIWPILVIVWYSALPAGCLIVGNTWMMVILRNRKRVGIRPRHGRHQTTIAANRERDKTITRMLFGVSLFFLLVSLPVCVYMVVEPVLFDGQVPRDIARRRLFWTIVAHFMYSNNAFNFLLYCVTGSLFRSEVKQLCRDCREGWRRAFGGARISPQHSVSARDMSAKGSKPGDRSVPSGSLVPGPSSRF